MLEASKLTTVLLVSLFLEPLLYGLLLILFPTSLFLLLKHGSRNAKLMNLPLLIIMFILATTHVSISLAQSIDAFNKGNDGSSTLQFLMGGKQLDVASILIFGAQTYIGDAIMLWRLHVVWNGERRMFIGLLLCYLANLAIAPPAILFFTHPERLHSITKTTYVIDSLTIAFYTLTFVTNVVSSFSIGLRIWWVNQHSISKNASAAVLQPHERSSKRLLIVAAIIIQSGAVYAVCLIILICCRITRSLGEYVVFEVMIQIIAITFTLLAIHVGLYSSPGNKHCMSNCASLQAASNTHSHEPSTSKSTPHHNSNMPDPVTAWQVTQMRSMSNASSTDDLELEEKNKAEDDDMV